MMSNKTLEINSIPIPPQLAGRLKQALGKSGTGFDEGAFLQQLHYWTLNPATTGWMIAGTKWIYNSLKSWQEQFPWMSEYGLRKAIANLKKLGLIQTAQHWISCCKRVMFYKIDYERLNTFTEDFCNSVTPRFTNSDHIDARSSRITNTETSPETSFSEQQTDVVADMNENLEDMNSRKTQSCNQTSEVEAGSPREDSISPASSGNNFAIQDTKFPELIDAVTDAIKQVPSPSLKQAIVQFPKRVERAIAYLQHQQQKQPLQNPAGYLYEAITKAWDLTISGRSDPSIPDGFRQWFDWAKEQRLVVAATMIDGIHHTLHTHQGWLPTEALMQEFSSR